jgi:hypothetical protein
MTVQSSIDPQERSRLEQRSREQHDADAAAVLAIARSAEEGNGEAQFRLGLLLRVGGLGLAPDPRRAVLWLERAALQHHPGAIEALLEGGSAPAAQRASGDDGRGPGGGDADRRAAGALATATRPIVQLRAAPRTDLDRIEAGRMIRRLGFFNSARADFRPVPHIPEPYENSFARGIANDFRLLPSGEVVFDAATRLFWRREESPYSMPRHLVDDYLGELRGDAFGDWRLPTLEEAMSLMKPVMKDRRRHIEPLFEVENIWTADSGPTSPGGPPFHWCVTFEIGSCYLLSPAIVIEKNVLAVRG